MIKLQLKITILTILLLISGVQVHANGKNYGTDPEKDRVLIFVLKNILTRGHFVIKDMDDNFSETVFHNFIDGLDPSKRYFTQKDIKEFSKYKYLIDNQLRDDKLDFYTLVYGRFLEKIKNAKNYYGQILAEPFNFSKNEIIDIDYDEIPFAKNENELIDYWRKQLKLQTLGRIQEQQEIQILKKEEGKITEEKSFTELEKEARKEVLKNFDELYYRIEQLEHEDWFSTFLNAVVGAFDPHTTYMAPRAKESFDQDMSGKLEGIGARLQSKGVYTHVFELVSGGPAWKQGDLEVGDIILKVAQGDKEPVDIVGMRLDDAIKFIKGPKGTEVRLTVKKKIDGSVKVISIIRDLVELNETFVKSSVVLKNNKKYGVIDLPSFYFSTSDVSFRDSGKDMKKEIELLKKEGVEGLIIDLRNNGGGSLRTAVEISGLFIDKGPIVQVKYRGEKPIVRSDEDPSVQWEKPVVLLVNEFSASASEIFAAAMQDYQRGVILGGNQTFGKGTVQTIYPINQFYKHSEDLGYLKFTIQKFYRVNGGSTQKEGVYSDIAMPSRFSYLEVGERDMEGALEWDRVAQADYNRTNTYSNFNEVIYNSKERIASSDRFKMINEYAKYLKENQEKTTYSLNFKRFTSDAKQKEKELERFKSVFDYKSDLAFTAPLHEKNLASSNEDLAEKRKAWYRNLSKDIYINEALNVLSELKLQKPGNLVKN